MIRNAVLIVPRKGNQMDKWNCNDLEIGNIKVRIPVIQGGMGIGISMSGLASAVANEGGVGVISAAGIGMMDFMSAKDFGKACVEALKSEISKARELTQGILGVNIMTALSNFGEMVKTSVEEGIDIIFAGAGLPLDLPSYLKKPYKTKLVPIVSSARAAVLIAKRWISKFNYTPDAFVVEGPKAGGHLGFSEEQLGNPDYELGRLVKEVIAGLKKHITPSGKPIPVIAAGGIYTGKDIKRFLDMGASGVQMATRFVTTDECDASTEFKQAYLDCKKEDIKIIKSPVGMPGRAIGNTFLEQAEQGNRKPGSCPWHCIKTCKLQSSPYCIASALINAQRGNLVNGFAFAGTNAYRTDKIVSVKELFKTLSEEFKSAD